jgi:hypothetical protein
MNAVTSTPGAFFEVTGKDSELHRIDDAINRSDGRLSSDSSATLDLWLEMREEWWKRHDAKVAAAALEDYAQAVEENDSAVDWSGDSIAADVRDWIGTNHS